MKSPKVTDLIYTGAEASDHASVTQCTKAIMSFRVPCKTGHFFLSLLPAITRLKNTPLDRSNGKETFSTYHLAKPSRMHFKL